MSSKNVTRRRGADLEKALLDAVWAELQAVGYTKLTFDNVAKRAGTSKPVLYRRWPHRLALVRASMRAHRPLLSGPIPNTNSLRDDVLAVLVRMTSGMIEVPDIIWGMASDAMNENLHEVFRSEITASNLEVMTAVLKKAYARGEIKTLTIPNRIITLPIDLVRHEMLIAGTPPDEATLQQIVDDIYLPVITRIAA